MALAKEEALELTSGEDAAESLASLTDSGAHTDAIVAGLLDLEGVG